MQYMKLRQAYPYLTNDEIERIADGFFIQQQRQSELNTKAEYEKLASLPSLDFFDPLLDSFNLEPTLRGFRKASVPEVKKRRGILFKLLRRS